MFHDRVCPFPAAPGPESCSQSRWYTKEMASSNTPKTMKLTMRYPRSRSRIPHRELHRLRRVAACHFFRVPTRLAAALRPRRSKERANAVMKHLLLLALLLAGADPQQAAIPYFTNVRDVSIAAPGQQNYFVVDPEIWTHARPDLGDLRLFDDASPVQYAISEQRASVSSNQVQARVLNLGRVSGH